MRTGILGGTFDPIHIAHLHAGETALHQLSLDRVVFTPAGAPWQKAGARITPAADRLEMVRLAIGGVEGFEVDDQEIFRDGPTYTIDTLGSYPADEELFVILGADAASRLHTWRAPDRVLSRATVVVAPRPGTDSTTVSALLADAMFLDMAALEVSGTEIREMARSGVPYRFLVPEPVHDYIGTHGLYPDMSEVNSVGESTDMEESS